MNNADLIAQNTLLKARLKDLLRILVDTLGTLGRIQSQTPSPAETIDPLAGLSQYDLAATPTKRTVAQCDFATAPTPPAEETYPKPWEELNPEYLRWLDRVRDANRYWKNGLIDRETCRAILADLRAKKPSLDRPAASLGGASEEQQ